MIEVTNLEYLPDLAPMIADRCWHAWWTDSDVTLAQYQAAIEGMRVSERIPTAFVAHQNKHYAGSTLLIENDLEERPMLTPWIAALWVEPAFRRQGIAGRLINAARSQATQFGHKSCYLHANEATSPYYAARGFTRIETNGGGQNIFAIPSNM